MTTFKALVTREEGDEFITRLEDRQINELPVNEILVRVQYSSLNYKDALSAGGNKGVTKNYPHTPGIDAAGVIEKSTSDKYKVGDEILLMGYDLGMNTPGGLAEYISVPEKWIIPKPKEFSLKTAMIYGTAGFTAALSVWQLIQGGIKPEDGPIAVSGATGGVGSIAAHLLSQKGYEVIASTGKKDQHNFLKDIGATKVIDRAELDDESGRPLLKGIYAAAIDTVGGNTLATLLKSVKYGGLVTTCGLTHGINFSTTVFPFIVKGIRLQGIDSVEFPLEDKIKIWNYMASEFSTEKLGLLTKQIPLSEVPDLLKRMLKGEGLGRTVIEI